MEKVFSCSNSLITNISLLFGVQSKLRQLFAFFLFCGMTINSNYAQSIQCDVEVPTIVGQELLAKQALIEEFLQNRPENESTDPQVVPVRFTIIAGPGGGENFTQAGADFAIQSLNQAFAPSIIFEQCGEINSIWDDRIKSSDEVDNFITSFSYTSGALEVYIKPTPNGVLPYAPIPDQSYKEGNPNWQGSGLYKHTNFIRLISSADLGKTFIHETGHHLGLLHTFWAAAPPNDHPYPQVDPNNAILPTWWGKELVIREPLLLGDPRPHKVTNFDASGDLIKDTPADCRGTATSITCPLSAQIAGCQFNATLTFKDHNNDLINPPVAGYSLGKNYMSYWNQSCLTEFTTGQRERMNFFFQTERDPKYRLNRCGTFTDRVEFEGSSVGLHNVSVRIRHTNSEKCNVTSGRLGDYSGILHSDQLSSTTYHNGLKSTLAFANDPLKVHYQHTRCEWIRGVTSADLLFISRHILGVQPFTNGYQMIAADVNKSGSITTFDIHELRKLILGIYNDNFPWQEQPWRFIPEFVPQNYSGSFNTNPFSLLGGGYLEQGWSYTAPALGKRGFDGIKVGDVNSTWLTDPTPPCSPEQIVTPGDDASLQVPNIYIHKDEIVTLKIKLQQSKSISAFQIGLKLPSSHFEILDISPSAFPDYTKTDNFGYNITEGDALTSLWYNNSSTPGNGSILVAGNSTLFSITVKATESINNLSEYVTLYKDFLPSLFYGPDGSLNGSVVALNLEVDPQSGDRSSNFSKKADTQPMNQLQCDPNPTDNWTNISVNYEEISTTAILEFIDVHGKTVKTQSVLVNTGFNQFRIGDIGDLPSGMYHVSLKVGNKIYTDKLLKN